MKHPLIGEHWNKPATEIYKGCEIRKVDARYFVFGMGYDTIGIARETIDKAFSKFKQKVKNDNTVN